MPRLTSNSSPTGFSVTMTPYMAAPPTVISKTAATRRSVR